MLDSSEHSKAQAVYIKFEVKVSNSIGHSAGAQEIQEMLGGMLYSFDHPKHSSTEQGKAKASKVVLCSVKCCIRLTRA